MSYSYAHLWALPGRFSNCVRITKTRVDSIRSLNRGRVLFFSFSFFFIMICFCETRGESSGRGEGPFGITHAEKYTVATGLVKIIGRRCRRDPRMRSVVSAHRPPAEWQLSRTMACVYLRYLLLGLIRFVNLLLYRIDRLTIVIITFIIVNE